jgi:hypothetical protein
MFIRVSIIKKMYLDTTRTQDRTFFLQSDVLFRDRGVGFGLLILTKSLELLLLGCVCIRGRRASMRSSDSRMPLRDHKAVQWDPNCTKEPWKAIGP